MKNVNAAFKAALTLPFRLPVLVFGITALLAILTLFQSDGHVVKADTSPSNVPAYIAGGDLSSKPSLLGLAMGDFIHLPNWLDSIRAKSVANNSIASGSLSAQPSVLVTKTWDGGGATNNWSEAANWSGDAVPVAGDDVVFDATSVKNVSIDTAVTVTNWQTLFGYTGVISQGGSNVTVNGTFTQAAGTFTAGTGALNFNGNITLNGGTFNAPTGTLSLSGGITVGAAAVFNSGGTLAFVGAGFQPFVGPAALTVNNLVVNKVASSQSLRFDSNTTLTVTGTLTLTDGLVHNYTGTGIIDAQGPVTIAPTFNDGGSTILQISGAAARTVTLPAGAVILPLTVNAPNVALNTSGAGIITFGQQVNIQSCASFTNGSVSFIFSQAFTFSGASNFTPGSGDLTFNGEYTQTSGTFTPGAGVLSFNGAFTINGGTFNSPAGNSGFIGAFAVNGGTFNAPTGTLSLSGGITVGAAAVFNSGGTLAFVGAGFQPFVGPAALTVNNLVVNKVASSQSLRFDSNTTLTVTGTLTLTDGLVHNYTGTGIIDAQGPVTIAPTFNDGGSTILQISGAAARTVTLPAGAVILPLTVNAPNVALNTSGAGIITFGQQVNIQSCASFTNGSVSFIFSQAFTFSGASNFTPGSGDLTFNGEYTQTSGTFTPGAGVLSFNGAFTINGGTFNSPAGNSGFIGAFAVNGGTFNAPTGTLSLSGGITVGAAAVFNSGGTLAFVGAGFQPFVGPAALTVNNLVVNKVASSQSLRFDSNTTLTVTGTLTLTDGLVHNYTGTGIIDAQGPVTIAPTFDGGSTNFRFSGGSDQTYVNPGGLNFTGIWTLNKSGGTVILNNDLNISNGTGDFALTNGTISTGANQVITGTRPITQTNGFIDGRLQQTITAIGLRQFDVGTVNGYAPVTINATAGTFPITFIAGGNDGTLAGSDPNQSLTRNWTLTPSGALTADISFKYLETDLPAGANEAGLRFLRRSGTTTDQGITTLDTTGNLATLNGVSTFSDWGLGMLPAGPCPPAPINFGNSFAGILDGSSCIVGGDKTDLYTFSGAAGQQIVITMTSNDFFSKIELLDPSSNVIAQAGGISGQGNVRLPVSAPFFTLPSTGIYTIRAIAPFGGSGSYILALFEQQTPGCTYTLSSSQTLVPPAGGSFRFTVLTQPGCPPAAPPAASGTIYSNASYSGGQVSFDVSSNPGAGNRQDTISVGGQTHTIIQYGQAPPTNDNFVDAQVLTGMSGTVIGGNTNATVEQGEPADAGIPAAHSIWYRWTAPDTGLFSFTTSGSSFDTTLAVYTGASVSTLTQIAANDDSASFDPTSRVVFHADMGIEYFVAVDGKNNSVGIVNLIYRQAARTYRFYAQTGNGNISPRTPTIIATRIPGGNQYTAVNLSPGLFELDLPVDNATYQVSITGTEIWSPNSFTIDNSSRPSARNNTTGETIDFEPDSGNLNLVINAVTVAATVTGFLLDVTSPDGVYVFLGSEGINPIAPMPCAVTMSTSARYECQFLVDTSHQIKPSLSAVVFDPVNVRFPPLNANLDDVDFHSGSGQTYNISGQVTADGSPLLNAAVLLTGHKINSYLTAEDGQFVFNNLPAGHSYTISVAPDDRGYVFEPLTIGNLQSNQVVNMAAQGGCTYSVSTDHMTVSADGGDEQLMITTDNGCRWESTNTASWITPTLGAGNGPGPMYFRVERNVGMGRSTTMIVAGREVTVEQENGCTYALSGGNHSFPFTGGSSSIDVTPSDAGCQWTPSATDYCMINGLSGGIGHQPLNFAVSNNAGVARNATIQVGNQTFAVDQAAAPGTHRAKFDFDGDGKADVSVYRPSEGTWYLSNSTTGFMGRQFGVTEDIPVAADYDGDGRSDLAVFRPSTGYWYVLPSTTQEYVTYSFGLTGDIPVPGDYDGDGMADLAVYRPSTGIWYLNLQSGVQAIPFGISEDKPVVGDYDGDGRSDIAVYRPSIGVWFLSRSMAGFSAVAFGLPTDVPVPADYDGDGMTDISVYRPSDTFWYRLNSSTGDFVYLQFGQTTDKPVPADYNGDSFADIAVYRPSTGYWYIWSCTGNVAITSTQFGLETDVPVLYPITP